MSFAFQGFGLGEYFKAQQRLTDVIDTYFGGIFDAPSIYLSLGRTLEDLSEEIEHLFDENSNPNSAILRSDNRLNVQQMLRVASHGLLDAVGVLDTLLQLTEISPDNRQSWCHAFFAALKLYGLEQNVILLEEKFSFQAWKLKLFFKSLRKGKIGQCVPVLENAQKTLTKVLEKQPKGGCTGCRNHGEKCSLSTNSLHESTMGSSSCETCSLNLIQRFKDSCHFQESKFCWNLKAESTLLIISHWLYMTKLGMNKSKDREQVCVKTYVNLIKTGWLLQVSYPDLGTDRVSEEARTLITIFLGEVIFMFQELDEHNTYYPDVNALASQGNYDIFVEGGVGCGYRKSITAESSNILVTESPIWQSKELDTLWSKQPRSVGYSGHLGPHPFLPSLHNQQDPILTLSNPVSSSTSLFNSSESFGFLKADIETKSIVHSQSSLESGRVSCSSNSSGLGSPRRTGKPGIYPNRPTKERDIKVDALQSSPKTPDSRVPNFIHPKLEYSWNKKVDRKELGVRPEEIEIMARDLPFINLLVSYSGDLHGRWDSCTIRLYKDCTGAVFRILIIKDGLENSFDEQFVPTQDSELVPEYGYHEHEPVICIRINRGKDIGNSLFFRFQSADDMFNFQLAFLGESVEADFHTVRALRIKRNSIENYQRAGVQFWREQDTDIISLTGVASVNTASTVRSNATVKVHSTRIAMYLYHERTIVLLFVTDSIEVESRDPRTVRIRSSSHNPFKNSVPVKARTLVTHDHSSGIPLDKAGLSIMDEDDFEDFKWFEVEFATREELGSFQQEFRRAINLRRKERKHADDLMRLAAQGVRANVHGQ